MSKNFTQDSVIPRHGGMQWIADNVTQTTDLKALAILLVKGFRQRRLAEI